MKNELKKTHLTSRLIGCGLLLGVCGLVWLFTPKQTSASTSDDPLNSAETQYYLEINSRDSRSDRIEQPEVASEPEPDRPTPSPKRQNPKGQQRTESKTPRPSIPDGQGNAQQNQCYRVGEDWKEERSKYAYSLNPDKNMILTFTAEGDWDEKKKSHLSYYCPTGKYAGTRQYDFGIGQVSRCYHPEIVDDPRFFTDWMWQLQQTIGLYKTGTKFYGHDVRNRYNKLITCN